MSLSQIVVTSREFISDFSFVKLIAVILLKCWEPSPLCRSLALGALGHPSCPDEKKQDNRRGQRNHWGTSMWVLPLSYVHACFFTSLFHCASCHEIESSCFHHVSWCPSISSQDLCSSIPCEGCLSLSSQLALQVPNEFGRASPRQKITRNHIMTCLERKKRSSTIQKTNTAGWKFAGFPTHLETSSWSIFIPHFFALAGLCLWF